MSLSPFREESLVSRINRGETDETDSLLRKIFTTSQQKIGRASCRERV